MKKFLLTTFAVFGIAGTALILPVTVFAATFNNDSQDFATLRVKNNTDFPTTNTGWATTALGDTGETIAFAIYYHNTASDSATNVRVRLSPQSTGVGTSHSFTAYVWADNAPQVSGSTSISLSSSQSMSFTSGSVLWRPNQTIYGSQALPNGQNGSEIFSANGLLLGDIASGWATQGSVVLNFLVGSTVTQPSNLPTVTTYPAEGVTDTFALLKGFVDPQNTSNTTRWFEWGTSPSSLPTRTIILQHGSSANTFTDTVSGLSSGTTYYYRAVAQNTNGVAYGGVQSFTTTGYGGGTQQPFVSTNGATNVSQGIATLNCYVNPYSTYNTTRWFEWGTTQSLGSRTITVNHGSTAANASETITGLASNATYYFRCVAQNSFGTTYGSILSFTAGTGITGTTPTAITNLATQVTQGSAQANGLALISGNAYTSGWFEWGVAPSLLGNTTVRQGVGYGPSTIFSAALTGLSSNTTYYYRAVVENQNGTHRGDILNFRTNSATIIIPSEPTPTATRELQVTKEVENLTRDNGTRTRTDARQGDTIRFTIEVENTGTATVSDVNIKDRIPHFLEFANAESANVDRLQREIVWFVGDMRAGDRQTVMLDVIVTEDARYGIRIDNIARAEGTNFTRNSNEVTIDVSEGRVAGAAAAFFSGAFLPNTLLEWLILILLLLGIIVLGRRLYGGYIEERKKKEELKQ